MAQKLTVEMSKTLRHIFQELNLIHLYEPFEVERIEVDNFLCLSDEEMERLGVSALGDRIRLRETQLCKGRQ